MKIELKLFVVYDKVRKEPLFPVLAPNPSIAIRENTPYLYQLNRDFENEFCLLDFGTLSERDTFKVDNSDLDLDFELISSFPKLVSWNSYIKFPEIVEQMTAREIKAFHAQPNGSSSVK